MKIFVVLALMCVCYGAWAQDGFQKERESIYHQSPANDQANPAALSLEPVEESKPFLQKNILQNTYGHLSITDFQDTYRMGLGFDMMGKSGLAGVSLHLVLTQSLSVTGGFGVAGGFSSTFVEAKQVIRQYKKVLAYWGLGLAQWASASGAVGDAFNPGFLRGKFLKPGEAQTGKFQHYLVSSSLGFKYLQTSGYLKGSSFYMELAPLFDLNSRALAPSAGFGVAFYF
ncbi:MAG: hypothetical protein HAW63_03145 [Bdellovibrionaceae bacterium]|nr:hypothetical protein [Pseudobdellovibrionaceae bacterium]